MGVFPNLLFLRGASSRICGPPINSIFFVRPLCAGNRNSSVTDITLSTGDFYDKLSTHISSHLERTVLATTLREAVTAFLSAQTRLIHLNSERQNGQIVLQIGLVCLFRVVEATVPPSVMETATCVSCSIVARTCYDIYLLQFGFHLVTVVSKRLQNW